jgi:hypothetical protein
MYKTPHRPFSRQSVGSSSIVALVILLLFLGTLLVGWSQRQAIYDWSRLQGYTPPDEIAQLAFDTTMNNSARRLFYVYHPQLEQRETFNQKCSGFGEQTIVLGCYVSNTGIYLFDVDDPRLQGVEQVTAAHELLHAAYDRLSPSERAKVDSMTAAAFKTLNDERIKGSIEGYRQRDSSIVPNELHSIIGTEVRNIPPDLETYYKKYFTNRHAIVAFSEKYESVLTARRNKAAALELQISGVKNEIDLMEKTLSEEQQSLRDVRSSVTTSEEAQAYNARVDGYNKGVHEFNALVKRYNALIEEYKSVALEAQELHKALDSRPTL